MKDNITNSNKDDYLDFSAHKESLVRLIYLVLVSLGTVAGNVLVFVAILRFKSLRRATNVMLGSLAFADFLVGTVTVPLYILWMTSPGIFDASIFMCGLVLLSCLLVVTASQISLMILSVEQYFAVCHPFLHRDALISHPRLHAIAVSSTWAISLVTTALSFLAFNTRAETCSYYGAFDKQFLFFASIIGVICPFVVIISLNVKVVFAVRAHDKRKISLSASSKRPSEATATSCPNPKSQIVRDSEQDNSGSQNQLVEKESNENFRDKTMSLRQLIHALFKYNKLRRRGNGYNISIGNRNSTVEVVEKDIFVVEVRRDVSIGYNDLSSMLLESTENIHAPFELKGYMLKYKNKQSSRSNESELFELKNEVEMKTIIEKNNDCNSNQTITMKDKVCAKELSLKTNKENSSVQIELSYSAACNDINLNQDKDNTTAIIFREIEHFRKRSFSLDSNLYKDSSRHIRFARVNSFSGFLANPAVENIVRSVVADTSNAKSTPVIQEAKNADSSIGLDAESVAGSAYRDSVTVAKSVNRDRASMESNAGRASIASNVEKDVALAASKVNRRRVSVVESINRDRASIAIGVTRDRTSIASSANRASVASSVSSRVSYMMALVCATFILAWCPFFVVVLMNTFCGDCDLAYFLNAVLIIAFTKSGANPVVYGLCHAAFRRAYSHLLASLCTLLKPRRLAALR